MKLCNILSIAGLAELATAQSNPRACPPHRQKPATPSTCFVHGSLPKSASDSQFPEGLFAGLANNAAQCGARCLEMTGCEAWQFQGSFCSLYKKDLAAIGFKLNGIPSNGTLGNVDCFYQPSSCSFAAQLVDTAPDGYFLAASADIKDPLYPNGFVASLDQATATEVTNFKLNVTDVAVDSSFAAALSFVQGGTTYVAAIPSSDAKSKFSTVTFQPLASIGFTYTALACFVESDFTSPPQFTGRFLCSDPRYTQKYVFTVGGQDANNTGRPILQISARLAASGSRSKQAVLDASSYKAMR